MVGDRCQNRAQIERRIEPIQLGCSDEAVERCSSLVAGVSSHEKVILPSNRNGTQRSLGSAIIDLQQTIVYVARQCTPVRKRIPDRARGLTLGRERMKRLLHPAMKIIEQRLGASLAYRATKLRGLAAYLFFDSVEGPDAGEGFGCCRRSMDHMNVVELAP